MISRVLSVEMATSSRKRLKNDLKLLQRDPPPGVFAELADDNLYVWDAVIFGPGDTCFEGGTFRLKMKFSKNFPNKAPDVRFYSRMFHPNVYPNGKICLDILEMEEKWNPDYSAATVLCAIQSMLGDPNPESPANGEANELYLTNMKEYERRVREVVARSEAEDAEDGKRNYNEEDQQDEINDRLKTLDLSEFEGDKEKIRNFLSGM